jgi:hypothetical protein
VCVCVCVGGLGGSRKLGVSRTKDGPVIVVLVGLSAFAPTHRLWTVAASGDILSKAAGKNVHQFIHNPSFTHDVIGTGIYPLVKDWTICVVGVTASLGKGYTKKSTSLLRLGSSRAYVGEPSPALEDRKGSKLRNGVRLALSKSAMH